MAFIRHKGKTVTRWLPVTTSTTFTKGDIVSWSSALLIKATSSTAANTHVGVIKKTIAATDADYAVARLVPVEVPLEKMVEWRGPVTSGLVAADISLWVDLTDAGTINRGASTYDAAQVKSVISATEGIFVLNLGGGTNTIN
jgi:hypothetical protein